MSKRVVLFYTSWRLRFLRWCRENSIPVLHKRDARDKHWQSSRRVLSFGYIDTMCSEGSFMMIRECDLVVVKLCFPDSTVVR